MKIFIIGGAGFIGSHLAKKLYNDGHEIMIYDDFSTGSVDNLEGIEYTRCGGISYGIKHCDIVYHLAASVGVANVNRDPLKTIKNDLTMQQMVFDINSHPDNQKPMFFASSSEVYGNSPLIPFSESNPLSIGQPEEGRWGYACSKLMGEFQALHSNFPVVVGRFFNVTGEGQLPDYGMVMPRFVDAAVLGGNLNVYGSGESVRSFCYVGDAVDAMSRLMSDEKCYNKVFNIGSMVNDICMIDLARLVDLRAGQGSIITVQDMPQTMAKYILKRLPDATKIYDAIGWKATTSLNGIVDRMIRWKQR